MIQDCQDKQGDADDVAHAEEAPMCEEASCKSENEPRNELVEKMLCPGSGECHLIHTWQF